MNHTGVISGMHAERLDRAGFNQWAIDDASGQLRMRLLSSYTAEVGLGHLIQQAGSAHRGSWRGSGFEASTEGWASLRADKGFLLSTSARAATYGSAQSTQMDASAAIAQLKAMRDLGQRLSQSTQAANAQGLSTHGAGNAVEKFIDTIDPKKLGKHEGTVNGQEAKKAQGRTLTDAVEAFATPVVLLDTPSTSVFASEASIASFSGEHLSITAQGDVQHTATQTYAGVSGQTMSLYTHDGGIKAIAANGPVSLRAHTDELQILADKDVTVISVSDEITIKAQTRIEITAGEASVVLDGGNITFTCPGNFQAKGSLRAFLGGGSGHAVMPALPIELSKLKPDDLLLDYKHSDGTPVQGAPYKVLFADRSSQSGALDASGRAVLTGVPAGYATVNYGEDARKAPLGSDEPNPLKGWMESPR